MTSSYGNIIGTPRDALPTASQYGLTNYTDVEGNEIDATQDQIDQQNKSAEVFFTSMMEIEKNLKDRNLEILKGLGEFIPRAAKLKSDFETARKAEILKRSKLDALYKASNTVLTQKQIDFNNGTGEYATTPLGYAFDDPDPKAREDRAKQAKKLGLQANGLPLGQEQNLSTDAAFLSDEILVDANTKVGQDRQRGYEAATEIKNQFNLDSNHSLQFAVDNKAIATAALTKLAADTKIFDSGDSVEAARNLEEVQQIVLRGLVRAAEQVGIDVNSRKFRQAYLEQIEPSLSKAKGALLNSYIQTYQKKLNESTLAEIDLQIVSEATSGADIFGKGGAVERLNKYKYGGQNRPAAVIDAATLLAERLKNIPNAEEVVNTFLTETQFEFSDIQSSPSSFEKSKLSTTLKDRVRGILTNGLADKINTDIKNETLGRSRIVNTWFDDEMELIKDFNEEQRKVYFSPTNIDLRKKDLQKLLRENNIPFDSQILKRFNTLANEDNGQDANNAYVHIHNKYKGQLDVIKTELAVKIAPVVGNRLFPNTNAFTKVQRDNIEKKTALYTDSLYSNFEARFLSTKSQEKLRALLANNPDKDNPLSRDRIIEQHAYSILRDMGIGDDNGLNPELIKKVIDGNISFNMENQAIGAFNAAQQFAAAPKDLKDAYLNYKFYINDAEQNNLEAAANKIKNGMILSDADWDFYKDWRVYDVNGKLLDARDVLLIRLNSTGLADRTNVGLTVGESITKGSDGSRVQKLTENKDVVAKVIETMIDDKSVGKQGQKYNGLLINGKESMDLQTTTLVDIIGGLENGSISKVGAFSVEKEDLPLLKKLLKNKGGGDDVTFDQTTQIEFALYKLKQKSIINKKRLVGLNLDNPDPNDTSDDYNFLDTPDLTDAEIKALETIFPGLINTPFSSFNNLSREVAKDIPDLTQNIIDWKENPVPFDYDDDLGDVFRNIFTSSNRASRRLGRALFGFKPGGEDGFDIYGGGQTVKGKENMYVLDAANQNYFPDTYQERIRYQYIEKYGVDPYDPKFKKIILEKNKQIEEEKRQKGVEEALKGEFYTL